MTATKMVRATVGTALYDQSRASLSPCGQRVQGIPHQTDGEGTASMGGGLSPDCGVQIDDEIWKMTVDIIVGDCLKSLRTMPDGCVQTCVTSPPYFGLRDYGHAGQIGLEKTPDEYVAQMVAVFREVRRVLRDDGTLWLNLGDSYAGSWGNAGGQNRGSGTQRPLTSGSIVKDQAERNGSFVPPGARGFTASGIKPKDLIGIPWRVAFALQADGWYLRQDIIWHKPNPMPESVTDRCTKAHEYIFLLSKNAKYYFDSAAMQEDGVCPAGTMAAKGSVTRTKTPFVNGRPPEYKEYTGKRNKRDVWTVTTKPFKGAHFATFPPDLVEPCILAGSRPGDAVLDPFGGAGTTGLVAQRHGRNTTLLELNPDYAKMARERIDADARKQLDALL